MTEAVHVLLFEYHDLSNTVVDEREKTQTRKFCQIIIFLYTFLVMKQLRLPQRKLCPLIVPNQCYLGGYRHNL